MATLYKFELKATFPNTTGNLLIHLYSVLSPRHNYLKKDGTNPLILFSVKDPKQDFMRIIMEEENKLNCLPGGILL